MKVFKEKDMFKGWFVGDFNPTCLNDKNCEVAVKRYKSGDYEEFHHHRVASEITMIISGKVVMNGVIYTAGDIILIEPKEGTDFKVVEDAVNVVVKIPSVNGDKYLGRYNGE